ncbi:putative F-box/FBD/LRR-repeat protein At5g44950 [Coffea arabica]|uniref:F-box/FBD/LRR-repeat protein At5g44950 n=1 Tax=Coffea arabica TaxID=13443 RepID=A0A6P6WZE7_COFAR|nr:uncharacterized protein LOC113735456 [Coffea arabica]XP_027120898.1 uncharacterized protein LOC113737965 [Coffea arabica]
MEDTGVVGDDSTSKLPEPIRHHIVSFLQPKEAARTSVLSKAWSSSWRTRPNLHFDYDEVSPMLRYANTQDLKKRRTDFINCINTALQRYHENEYGIDSLKLEINAFKFPSLAPDHVNAWLQIAAETGVKSLNICINDYYYCYPILPKAIFEATSLVELCLSGQSELEPEVIKMIRCHSLRKLCLVDVRLDEMMLEKIMSSCPLIEVLEISLCVGLANVKLSKLQELKECRIVLRNIGCVEIEAPGLKDFYCWNSIVRSYLRPLPPIRMYTCNNLKRLSLNDIGIKDEFFLGIAGNFPHLEELAIQDCYHLQTIKISSHSIKIINLGFAVDRGFKEACIDVPSIVRFEYKGNFIPLFCFTAPSGPWVSDIELSWHDRNILETSFFSKLKELLKELNRSEISLKLIFSPSFEGFIEAETRNSAIHPLPQVQELSISFNATDSLNVAHSILDGIFWTCRPKTMVQYCYHDLHFNVNCTNRAKVLFQMLMFRKNQKHSSWQQPKFWQKDLKDVKLEMFQKGKRVQQPQLSDWETFLKVIETEKRSYYLVFELEWQPFGMNRKRKRTRSLELGNNKIV